MHYLVGVVARQPYLIDDLLNPYGQEAEEYFERVPYMNRETYIANYRQYNPNVTLTDEEIWDIAHDEWNDVDDDAGMIYENYNPQAQWDWYVIGGRFTQTLRVMKKTCVDNPFIPRTDKPQRGRKRWVEGAKFKDILWSDINKTTPEKLREQAHRWDTLPENSYDRRRYGTKENYLMKINTHIPFAFVDEEGVWRNEEMYDSYDDYAQDFYNMIHNPALQDWWYVIVDCHF